MYGSSRLEPYTMPILLGCIFAHKYKYLLRSDALTARHLGQPFTGWAICAIAFAILTGYHTRFPLHSRAKLTFPRPAWLCHFWHPHDRIFTCFFVCVHDWLLAQSHNFQVARILCWKLLYWIEASFPRQPPAPSRKHVSMHVASPGADTVWIGSPKVALHQLERRAVKKARKIFVWQIWRKCGFWVGIKKPAPTVYGEESIFRKIVKGGVAVHLDPWQFFEICGKYFLRGGRFFVQKSYIYCIPIWCRFATLKKNQKCNDCSYLRNRDTYTGTQI